MFSALQSDRVGFFLSILGAGIAVLTLAPAAIMSTFIVMGQGHFILAYLYQWRAGKIGWRYGALYVLAFSTLLLAYQFIPEPKLWTFLVAGSIFAIHFFVDEYFLAKLSLTTERVLLGVAFIGLYSALLMHALYGIQVPYVVAIVALLLLLPVAVQAVYARTLTLRDAAFILGSLGLVFLLIQEYVITLYAALGFTILAHYLRWYVHFYARLQAHPDQSRLRRYLIDVAVVNVIVILLFLLYNVFPESAVRYAFEPTFFFIWTILHVLFSIRLSPALLQRFGVK